MPDIAHTYKPVFRPWDAKPIDVTGYLSNATIRDRGVDRLLDRELMASGGYSADAFVLPPDRVPEGTPTVYHDHVVYSDHVRVTYMYFFAVNEGYLFGRAGFHYGDWEHCTIEFDRGSASPVRMYFAAHGSGEGRWVGWEFVEKSNGRPVVYLSTHSNASYPEARLYPRIFGFANDKTRRRGAPLVTYDLKRIQNEFWSKYAGYMGCDRARTRGSVRNAPYAGWFRNESDVSTTTWKQLTTAFIRRPSLKYETTRIRYDVSRKTVRDQESVETSTV